MIYKEIHKLKTLAIIIAISTFFFFSFTSSPLACSHIQVNTNLEAATFTLYGPEMFSGSGTSWHKVASDGGPIEGEYYEIMTYEIVYGDVEGYITPPSETKYLPVPNGIITFNGIYERIPGYSVNITSGDVDGDGIDEIITGAGPRPNAGDEIEVIINEHGEYLSMSVFRADIYDRYGVNVAGGDLDGDAIAEIVTGAGPGPQNEAIVQIFDAYGEEKTYFVALDTKYGANVAVGNLGLEANQVVADVNEYQEVANVAVGNFDLEAYVEVEEVNVYQEVADVNEYQDVADANELLNKEKAPSSTKTMLTYLLVRNIGLTEQTHDEFEAMLKRYDAEDERAYYIELVANADSDEQKRTLLRYYKKTMTETQYQSIYWQLFQDGYISWNFSE